MAAAAAAFIGSKISLISKSEIRYEGILYSLDIAEATISLAKVKSFGTEDRPTPRPLPPKDEIYEFIIFRGTDIKGIDVVEPPATDADDTDPAIVEVKSYDHVPPEVAPPPPVVKPSAQPQHVQPAQRPAQQSAFQPPQRDGPRDAPAPAQSPPRRENPAPAQRHLPREHPAPAQQHREPHREPQRHLPRQQQQVAPHSGGRYQYRVVSATYAQRRPQQQRGGGRKPFIKFDSEFDFEKANEDLLLKLEEVKITEEVVEREVTPSIFYSKDNFFDNISCEGNVRNPRPDWKAERKLNAETFGVGGGYRGRGGRGRGGRGYNSGGGGRGYRQQY